MSTEFKHRPKIESISDLQDGDEFLVGESRWVWEDGYFIDMKTTGTADQEVAGSLIQAKVPIERDIPCPEGYKLKMGDGVWIIPKGAQIWCQGRWENWEPNAYAASSNIHIYAIPIQPEEITGEITNIFEGEATIAASVRLDSLPVGWEWGKSYRVRVTVLEEVE